MSVIQECELFMYEYWVYVCWWRCNHLLVYEPGYYEKTFEYITAAYMPWHYESSIRELTMRYCQSADESVPRNFSFSYDILGKSFDIFVIFCIASFASYVISLIYHIIQIVTDDELTIQLEIIFPKFEIIPDDKVRG